MWKYLFTFLLIIHGLAHISGPLGFWTSGPQAFVEKPWIFSRGVTPHSAVGSAFGLVWLVVALVGGVIYPAVVQALVVNPNQQEREQPYIERNVNATREALNLTDVDVRSVAFGSLTATDVEDDIAPLENVRLLNPVQMESRFLVDRGEDLQRSVHDLRIVGDRHGRGEPDTVVGAERGPVRF